MGEQRAHWRAMTSAERAAVVALVLVILFVVIFGVRLDGWWQLLACFVVVFSGGALGRLQRRAGRRLPPRR